MTSLALVNDDAADPGRDCGARLVVTDAADVVVGWVDLLHDQRHVADPGRADMFHDAVDMWRQLVDYSTEEAIPVEPATPPLRVTETRFPDAVIRRSLVIPFFRPS